MLSIASLAHLVSLGMLYMCMPALFYEMTQKTHMSMRELNQAWAWIPLASIPGSILGGSLTDRFGLKYAGAAALFAAALFAGLRGVSDEYPLFAAFMALYGFASAVAYVNLPKLVAAYFPDEHSALAQGILFASYGFGAALATVLAAPLSAWFGGWHVTLLVFAGAAAVISFAWLYSVHDTRPPAQAENTVGEALRHSARELLACRDTYTLCAIYFLFTGAYLGISGLLPYYLERSGWSAEAAGSAPAVATLAFVSGCVLVPYLSDALGYRRVIFLVSTGLSGLMLLATWWTAQTPGAFALWIFLGLQGFTTGAIGIYFALFMNHEILGDPRRSGAALGLATACSYAGGALFPLIGYELFGSHPMYAALFFGLGGFGTAGLLMMFVSAEKPTGEII